MNPYRVRQSALLLFLFISTFLLVFAAQTPLSLFSKAAGNPSAEGRGMVKVAQLSQQVLDGSLTASSTTLTTDTYQLPYDPMLWTTVPAPEGQDVVLDAMYGYARVHIVEENIGNVADDALDVQAATYEKMFRADGSYVSKIKTTLAGNPVYQFTRKETFLGKSTTYEEYLAVYGSTRIRITARYDHIGGAYDYVLALLSRFHVGPVDEKVRGAATSGSLTKYEAVQIAELVKPSVAHIMRIDCHTVVRKTTATYLKVNYPFCTIVKGSGMIINPDGYIATNGHVVKAYAEESFSESLLSDSLKPFVTDFLREVVQTQSGTVMADDDVQARLSTLSTNPTAVNSLLTLVYEYMDKGVIGLSEKGVRYLVRLGNDPFVFDEKKIARGEILTAVNPYPSIYDANLVAYDFPNQYSLDAVLRNNKPKGSDVALLALTPKTKTTFPAVPIRQSKTLKEGESLVVVGYPSIVEGDAGKNTTSILDYRTSSVRPSVTRGIVSALKYDDGGKLLVQTDASIEKGNSGGPAFDEQGQMVGVTTYGFFSTIGTYNFLRDTNDVIDLAKQKNITLTGKNEAFTLWQEGLSYYWHDQHTKALAKFLSVQALYPSHPTVQEFIDDARAGIKSGQDADLVFGVDKQMMVAFVIAGGSVTIVWFLILRKKKKHWIIEEALQEHQEGKAVKLPYGKTLLDILKK